MQTYITFKKDFRLESYLLYVKDFKLRKLYSKLRLSSHDLEVERGRYQKPRIPREDRLCKMCNVSIEDKEHFFIGCNAYDQLRQQYFKLIKYVNPQFNLDFGTIMMSKNEKVIFYSCKFLEKALLLRADSLTKVKCEPHE